jgi:hypothetical protein
MQIPFTFVYGEAAFFMFSSTCDLGSSAKAYNDYAYDLYPIQIFFMFLFTKFSFVHYLMNIFTLVYREVAFVHYHHLSCSLLHVI